MSVILRKSIKKSYLEKKNEFSYENVLTPKSWTN